MDFQRAKILRLAYRYYMNSMVAAHGVEPTLQDLEKSAREKNNVVLLQALLGYTDRVPDN